jgi:AhpD family alkylhydroperoxidase
MTARIDFTQVNPAPIQQLLAIERYLAGSSIGTTLLHLMKMRASQINGCAYCLDMHSKDARAHGETEQRLYGLNAWRETSYYTERERAALAWLEAITQITQGHAPDAVYEGLQAHFTQQEIMDLTLVAAMINLWNRVSISVRTVPGTYRPGMYQQAAH